MMKRIVPDVFSPAMLGPVRLRKRTISAAASEGRSPQGLVSEELIAFHRGLAEGGIGMTTVAYCAVAPEGFCSTGQILMGPKAVKGLKQLTKAVHEAGAAVSAQLGHGGPVAMRRVTGMTPMAPSWFINPSTQYVCRGITRNEIKKVEKQFADAAELAAEAGFDAVELHFGHLYLVSSFLSPWINRRKDDYGGSIENRTRMAIETARAVRERVGKRVAITAKLSMSDDIRGSIWIDESLRTAEMLDQDGQLDAIELTQGSSVFHPMYLFRGDIPTKEICHVMKCGLKPAIVNPPDWATRIAAPFVMGRYPYHDMYMMEHARQFVPKIKKTKLIYLGGVNNHQHMQRAMEEGFEFVAMGRALMREPNNVKQIQVDPDRKKQGLCIHCNKCMFTVFEKTHCPLNPNYAIFRP